MSMDKLMAMNGAPCPCGREHRFDVAVEIGAGAVLRLPAYFSKFGAKKVYLLSDRNTWAAAGHRVAQILKDAGVAFVSHSFQEDSLEPDEKSVGSAVMHFDWHCDMVVAVGSGVINDIGKIVAAMAKLPYIIVGTAPSMDGYASATSSMTRDGLKISLNSKGADVIIGDTDILCQAPLHMMKAGLGDMLAKYVSICEWRIAQVVTDEYYCPQVAELVRSALKQCVDRAEGLLQRDRDAVQAVFEGLVIGGVAMNYAGLSRPASGVEHYISHCIDMRAVEFGTPMDLHGVQCAIGTKIATQLYEKVRNTKPDRAKALAYAKAFDYEAWSKTLRGFLGRGADSMIALEAKEGKYDAEKHALRLEWILENWDALCRIMDEELPSFDRICQLLQTIDAPDSLQDIGIDDGLIPTIFACTKDIRDKYVLSRLCWDLGILDEITR